MSENIKKKIIIISEYYAPENAIGAVRMSKITKYLNLHLEYDILVISKARKITLKDEMLEKDVQGKATIVRIPGSQTAEKIYNYLKIKYPKDKSSQIKSKFINGIRFFLSGILDPVVFKRRAIQYIQKNGVRDYSAVISTYGPLPALWIGRAIKKMNPEIRWIADFRDPIYNIFTPRVFKNYAKSYARRMTKSADVIVAVSSGYLAGLFLGDQQKKCMITNGYDPDDLNIADYKRVKTKELILSYSGGLYAGRRDFSILFQALGELCQEGKIEKELIQVHYAGQSGSELFKQAQKFGLETIVFDHHYMTRSKALELQMNSDALLLAAWNTAGGLGNIPGKFFEYMLMNKPILCITTGEIPKSEIKEIIQSGNLGFCYEEAVREEDFQTLKRYVYDLYCYKVIEKKPIPFSPITQVVESYSYASKAREYQKLLSD